MKIIAPTRPTALDGFAGVSQFIDFSDRSLLPLASVRTLSVVQFLLSSWIMDGGFQLRHRGTTGKDLT
jgi:hypothetical protein